MNIYFKKHLLICVCLINTILGISQVTSVQEDFLLKGKVVDEFTNAPIKNVNIEIKSGDYTTTGIDGSFKLNAKIGDELVIKNSDFKTVYYKVSSRESITVKVQALVASTRLEQGKFRSHEQFIAYLDSARAVMKFSAERSIEYVAKALEGSSGKPPTSLQKAMAFETLGDTYQYWALFDLAIDNYKRSIKNQFSSTRSIKLGAAYSKHNNYQEAIQLYTNLLKNNLTPKQKTLVYEGLGDVETATGKVAQGVGHYREALTIAQAQGFNDKVLDLNSKIGAAFARDGNIQEADSYYGNTLELSKKENPARAAAQKNTVADYYSQNGEFEKEIQLREETINEIENLSDDNAIKDQSSPLTPQRQNYKIANALLGQEKYIEAIPYLEKSIEEADEKADLIVEKDARRKLSEVYADIGEFDKAAEGYKRYTEVFDELYIKKEQELSQATRFAREIAAKQNRIAGLENERSLNESRYKLAFENQTLIEQNNKTQKWIIGSLMLVALLLLYTAYVQYKNVKQQKYANNLLALKSLRTQMNPHFIFNALNSVNSFIATNDERAANAYLSEFSQLMRSVLENSEEDFIPLSKEIELLELYTKLEHFRFKDKFEYSINVDESIAQDDFVIPPMLLQPYVENAVWHGLRYKEEKGKLAISFKKMNAQSVMIIIEDNGIGRIKSAEFKTENQKKQRSQGMGNIKKRIGILNEMYDDRVDVSISDVEADGTGTRVSLVIKKD